MMKKDEAAPDVSPGGAQLEYHSLTAMVRDLVQVMRDGGIGQLAIEHGDLKISLSALEPVITANDGHHAPAMTHPGPPPVADDQEDASWVITSPMIGTFYAAPAPGERPFVQPGETVDAGQTVAIIEAMKIMNEIVAERPGIVDEILVKNGEPVEYGQPLMRLRPLL